MTPEEAEVGFNLGERYQGWSVGNHVRFRARPKGVKGAAMQMVEGRIRRIERCWGNDLAIVRDDNGQCYDVKLRDLEIADAVSLLARVLDDG